MKKITLLILIFLTFWCSKAFSEMKLVAKSVKGSSFYVDFNSIKKKDGLVYFWSLTDYYKTAPSGTNSIKAFMLLECDLLRFKILSDHAFTGKMGKGKVTINNKPDKEWNYNPPGSAGYLVDQKVCNYVN